MKTINHYDVLSYFYYDYSTFVVEYDTDLVEVESHPACGEVIFKLKKE